MSAPAAIGPQWPVDVVRVTYTPRGVRLHFPALRGWRRSLRLALIGVALFVPSCYAAMAFAPPAFPDAAAVLTLALTASVVFPVLLFGALFVLVALYAVANSLTVEVDTNGISTERRVLGFSIRTRTLPAAAIRALESKPVIAHRGLGGHTSFQLIAAATGPHAGLIVADGVPDETQANALKTLIARYVQLDCGPPGRPDLS